MGESRPCDVEGREPAEVEEKRMASLYELSAEYSGLLDAYANAQNEDEAADIIQSLVDIHGELAEKAENYVRVIKNVQSGCGEGHSRRRVLCRM